MTSGIIPKHISGAGSSTGSMPFVKIWHAGCATGEEAYSVAILLKEEGLYDRTTIYATDFNQQGLSQAEEGIFPSKLMKEYTANYQLSGGKESFSFS